MRTALLVILLLGACGESSSNDAGIHLELFGNPISRTGLGPDQCRPSCSCGPTVFAPPVYDDTFIQSLITDWQLVPPYPPLASDPYAQPPPEDDPPGTVCAVLPTGTATPRTYELHSYGSMDDAVAAGAHPTHFGRCGVCSTLANLAVYMRENDLGQPVRACAFAPASSDGGDGDLECLMGLGFDLPCAQIWAYNTAHTRSACLEPCVAAFTDPYNQPDGTLNPCLQCDEDQSGPVFKAIAGRTRRNSGLPNAICRPCDEVQPLIHDYGP